MEFLEMYEEYPLNKKPPQIDILIIKKLKDITLNKTISRIFRTHNIIEYKAPGDYLSVNDFYKVYGYTCFYQSNTDKIKAIDPRELTITFVCSHYPREMLRHLEEMRGITATFQDDGIYYLTGDAIPIQLLITHKLTQDENYWLQNLRTDLKAGREIRDIVARYEKNRHSKDYAAVMNLITRANWKEMEAERKMCDALKELFAEELQEENAKGMERGKASRHREILRKKSPGNAAFRWNRSGRFLNKREGAPALAVPLLNLFVTCKIQLIFRKMNPHAFLPVIISDALHSMCF